MRLRDILSLKINLPGKSRAENFRDTEFRRILEVKEKVFDDQTQAETEITSKAVRIITSGSGTRKNFITLAPMKSLSLEDFTFPFSNSTKIREALRLQVMPFSAAGEVELFPVVLSKSGRTSGGVVWYVSPDELDIPALAYDSGTGKIWPAPLPFVSQLEDYGGTGVTMWVDEDNVCSLLWQTNKPVLYRWRKLRDEHTEEKELAWYDSYCTAREIDRGGTFVVNASGDNDDPELDEEFCGIISESVKICPWISGVNLSRSALEGARGLERNLKFMTRAACWILGLGVIMLGAGILRWQQIQTQAQDVRTRSENFYKQVFDPARTGRISNPVTLARDRIAELTGSGSDAHPLEEVLADLGEIFSSGQSMDVTLDVIRYNSEGIDCTGSAPDMTTILNFRKAWEERASLAQVDNTQSVSGIGYRFDLRVRW